MELDLCCPICLHGMRRDNFTFTFIILFLMVVLIILVFVKGGVTVVKFESTTVLTQPHAFDEVFCVRENTVVCFRARFPVYGAIYDSFAQ